MYIPHITMLKSTLLSKARQQWEVMRILGGSLGSMTWVGLLLFSVS